MRISSHLSTLLATPAALAQTSSDGSGFQSALDALTQQAGGAVPASLKVAPVTSATANDAGKAIKANPKFVVDTAAPTNTPVDTADTDTSTIETLPPTPASLQQPVVALPTTVFAPPISEASTASSQALSTSAPASASTTDTSVLNTDEQEMIGSSTIADTTSSVLALVLPSALQAAQTLPADQGSAKTQVDATPTTTAALPISQKSTEAVKTPPALTSSEISATETTARIADAAKQSGSNGLVDTNSSTTAPAFPASSQVLTVQTQSLDHQTLELQADAAPKATSSISTPAASTEALPTSSVTTSKVASTTHTTARTTDKSDKNTSKVLADTTSATPMTVPVLLAEAQAAPVQTVSLDQVTPSQQADTTPTTASPVPVPTSGGQADVSQTPASITSNASQATGATDRTADKPEIVGSKVQVDAVSPTTVAAPLVDSQTTPVAAVPGTSRASANTISAIEVPATSGAFQMPKVAAAIASSDSAEKTTTSTATDAQTQAAMPADPSMQALFDADLLTQTAGQTFALPMSLPLPTASSSKTSVTSLSDKAAVKPSAQSATQTDANSLTAAAPVKNKAAASTTIDSPSHRAQDNSQSSQQSQSGSSDKPATTPTAAAVQPQAATVHANSHAVDNQANTPLGAEGGDVSDPARRSALNGDASATRIDSASAPSSVNTAAVLKTMAGTEMHLGMHSTEFGNISIRTTVSPQQMTTQISTDHSDLGQAISAHVSSAQTKIGDDLGMRATISVNNQTASSFTDSGSSSPREQRAMQQSFQAATQPLPAELDIGLTPGPLIGGSGAYRLDIRA